MKLLTDNEKLFDYFEVESLDDLFVGVSGRKPTTSALIEFLHIKKQVEIPTGGKAKTRTGDNCPVYCKGAGKIAISLASCCTPIPGDDIIGYVTRGKGIIVHRKNCPNIAHEKERLVDVFWRDDLEFATYPVDIMIDASDRPNLLIDIMKTISNAKAVVSSIHAKLHPTNLTCSISATVMVSDAKRLNDIFNVIYGVTGVYEVSRVIH